ncbi:MAG: S46 family peptidase [Bacteroidales bacterium]|nr:S46 family peptidase [Bacteroidales bacterium]MCF8455360.1 S46 family peptidase [Bacteroidales bacterium]
MKKILLLSLLTITILSSSLRADEGMWLPLFIERLNYADMQKLGLKLTPEEIYSVNHSSLKDAIVQFGGGCTGEIISDQGLLLTNHHCGLGQIQEHSSIEHDYLTNGFWAMNKDEELANPGLSVSFLVRMEDVTALIADSLFADSSETYRMKTIQRISSRLQKAAEEGNHYKVQVKPFFGGNEFYLFVYEVFTDVRLVGAPPWGIGKYGADTDNWMWPRHKGDFSLFRVYSGPDGKPADYSKDNIPLKPKHFLPVSTGGIKEGDFAMTIGFPGRTTRYMTSKGVEQLLNENLPAVIDVRTKKLDIYRASMDVSDDVRIKYASKQARTSNYWKYAIGQVKQLKQNKIIERKLALENDISEWIANDETRKQQYGKALDNIKEGYEILSVFNVANQYFMEAIYQGSEILAFAYRMNDLAKIARGNVKPDLIPRTKERLKSTIEKYFADYDLETDKKVFAAMMELYNANVPIGLQPDEFIRINKKYKGNYEKFADKLFDKSNLAHLETSLAMLDKPKSILKDPAFELMDAFFSQYIGRQASTNEGYSLIEVGDREFIDALRKMDPEKKYYPDANFTMRVSYGQVKDYYPCDAVHYDYYTTMDGVMEKEKPGDWEFDVPAKLKELYENKSYGSYATEDGEMMVNFITTNDITGGNSGSPVIDGEGNLVGLAFDGNWEAMSGDVSFEKELQRTICVDIRFVLFVIHKYAGAKHLIEEMTLVN